MFGENGPCALLTLWKFLKVFGELRELEYKAFACCWNAGLRMSSSHGCIGARAARIAEFAWSEAA